MEVELTLKVESPLHIGSGETYVEMDFIADKRSIKLIDYEKLLEMVEFNKEVVDKLMKAAETGEVKNSITEIFGIDRSQIPFSKVIDFIGKEPERSLKIQKHIQTSGRAYIPGSSIKGFLRTAVLFKFLEENPDVLIVSLQKLKKRLSRERNPFRFRKKAAELFEKEVFGSTPHKDIFRSLMATDSSFAENTAVYEVRIIGNPQTIPLYLECIPPKEILNCKVQIDESIKETDGRLKYLTFDYIVESVRHFTKQIIKEDKTYRNYPADVFRFYSEIEGKDLMRLGHSTGYFSKTIGMLLKNFDEFEFDFIRRKFGMGRNPRTKRTVRYFPKTRRIAAETKQPLGWVSFDWQVI